MEEAAVVAAPMCREAVYHSGGSPQYLQSRRRREANQAVDMGFPSVGLMDPVDQLVNGFSSRPTQMTEGKKFVSEIKMTVSYLFLSV